MGTRIRKKFPLDSLLMSLRKYHSKRRFEKTPEPKGTSHASPSVAPRFVIQKHDATRLHFDFRLEIDGVLKSWAVPRGPSMHPGRRRLAVMTEDHPLEYATFEGMIPEGEYGGGPVILWDQGTWQCDGSPAKELAKGKLRIHLNGQRLRGGWHLVRTAKEPGDQWLLMKQRDADALATGDADPVDTQQTSVVSGRTLDQIRNAAKAPAGGSKQRASRKQSGRKQATQRRKGSGDHVASTATLADLPPAMPPKLPRLVDHPPTGDAWVHELKLDGYRMQARVAGGNVQLLTRNHQDWTQRLPALASAVAGLPVDQAVFDGELVALDAQGATDFGTLQRAFREGATDRLVLYVFDLLYLNGQSLVSRTLLERKAILEPIIRGAGVARIQYLDHLEGNGKRLLDQCRQRGLEGIVSKRRDRGYAPGRAEDWLKCKCRYRERFVVGGFTESKSAAGGIGALLVGYYDSRGELVYSGRVGSGLDERTGDGLRQRLTALAKKSSPFAGASTKDDQAVVWVDPEVVVEVAFNSWTRDGLLRHASLAQVEQGVPSRSVVRDSLTVDAPPGDRLLESEAVEEKSLNSPVDDSLREVIAEARITSPERVLYPAEGYTKLELITYLTQTSAWLLPHIQGRPLSIVRCPDGIGGECFFQKHVKAGMPKGFSTVRAKSGEEPYLVIEDVAGLVAAAQFNALELHPWGARRDRLDRPDRLIFDLDPDVTVPWEDVVAAAWQMRERLEGLGLVSFVKTTGGKGLHVVVPLVRRHDWDRVFEFASGLVRALAAEFPKRYTANMAKRARADRIFIDFHRNRRGATAIAAYSPRAREGATVATPLAWEELSPQVPPDQWTIRTVPTRLRQLSQDPWAEMAEIRQGLKRG